MASKRPKTANILSPDANAKVVSDPPATNKRRRDALGRIGFTIAEAASALGTRAPALRRHVERHAEAVGDEVIAHLTGGITARKRRGHGRWLILIPPELRT